MSYYEPEEEFYSGFDPSDPAMIQAALAQYLMGQGEFGEGGMYGDINVPTMDPGQYDALAGLLPNTQPSGKPMTVSNITGALSANRSALFDPALMAFGGMDAFAPNAFESTVTSTIVQTPELQQMYGYLRSPDSVEGLIANEVMNGGTPSTAVRKLRELLASPDTDPEFKASLLMELPQRPVDYGMPAPELAVENVNWDADEGSVFAQARGIGELYAQIPRVGPSGPQWDPNTGQQISAGGQLQWGEDESGAPVMIEVTETPSPLAEKYHALGLPTPDEEYMTEDFLPGDWQGESDVYQQAVPEIQAGLAEAKQRWRDATPPGSLGLEQLAGTPPAQLGAQNQLTREPLPAGSYVPPYARAEAEQAAQDPFYSQYPVLADPYVQIPELQPREVLPFGESMQGWEPEPGHIFPGEPGFEEHEQAHAGGQIPAIGQPSGPAYPAGDPRVYEEFLAQQGGGPRVTAGGQVVTQEWNPNRSQPEFGDNLLANALQQMIQAGQPAPSTATPEMTQAMLMQIMGGNAGPGYRGGDREPARQPGEPGYRGGDREPARQPGGPEYIETGEQQARNEPTGIPTRAGAGGHQLLVGAQNEQRNYDRYSDRSELREIRAADQAERDRLYGADFGRAWAQARNLRQQGVRPLDQALMARRLVLMGAGMPQGRMPGL